MVRKIKDLVNFLSLFHKKKDSPFDIRIESRGILYARISGWEELLFEVTNVSKRGFQLKPILDKTNIIRFKELSENLTKGKVKKFEVSFYAPGLCYLDNHTCEKSPDFVVIGEKIQAYPVSIQNSILFGFKVDRLSISKMDKIYNHVAEIKKSFITREEIKKYSQDEAETRQNLLLSQFTLLFSLLETKKEEVKSNKIRLGFTITIFIFFFMTGIVASFVNQYSVERKLNSFIENYEKKYNSKVLFLIHRKKHVGLFGIPVYEYLEVNDAHHLLSELSKTSPDKNLLLIIHSPGGELLAGMQIAKTLKEWKGKVTVVIPYYAMSAGTLISLAADEVYAKKTATFGPIDPQIPVEGKNIVSSVDVVKECAKKDPNRLELKESILCSAGKKVLKQTEEFLRNTILRDKPAEIREKIIQTLLYTKTTHDYPFFMEDMQKIGIPVKTDYPKEIDSIVDLLLKNSVPVNSR